jgi:hypothetical protein
MSLNEDIARVIRDHTTSTDAAAVLGLAEAEANRLAGEMADAESASLSPLLDADEAERAHAAFSAMGFTSRRLIGAIDALRLRVKTLAREEAEAVRDAEKVAALKERDELAAIIADKMPDLIKRYTAIVRDVEASDNRLSAAGLVMESAEGKARGYSGNGQWIGGGVVTRFRDTKLPMFSTPEPAWRFDFGAGVMRYPALGEGA